MKFKEKASAFIGGRFSLAITRKDRIGQLFEAVHLKKFFKHYKVDCVFDVGANEGQYATMLRKKVGFKGTIVSFEPVPEVAKILRQKARSDPHWHVEEAALDRAEGDATFKVMYGNQFSSLHAPKREKEDLFMDQNAVVKEITVNTKSLAEVFKHYKKELGFVRPFLKMDTQGHDLAVAEGGGGTLKEFVGIQSELSVKPIYDDVPDYTKVIEYYQSQGFALSAFVPNNEGHFPYLIETDCIMYNKNF